MRIRWRIAAGWAALALILGLLCGCTGPAAPKSVGYVYPDETVPPETLPPAPEPLPAVHTLSCLEVPGVPVILHDAGEGRVLVCCRESEADDWENPVLTLYLVDGETDTLIGQTSLKDDLGAILGVRPDGQVITADYEKEQLCLYGSDLRPAGSLPLPEELGVYDAAADCFYGVEDGGIVKRSLPDLEPTVLLAAPGAGITASDGGRDLLLLSCRSADDRADGDYCLYDTRSGRVLLQGREEWGGVNLIASGLAVSRALTTDETELPMGDDDSAPRRLEVYDAAASRRTACWEIPGDCTLYTHPGTDVSISIRYPWGEDGGVSDPEILALDLTGGSTRNLKEDLGAADWIQAVYLPAQDAWALAVSSGTEEGDKTRLVLVRPAFLEWDGRLTAAPGEDPAPPLHEAGELLAEQRARADAMEQAYGIRILLGDEILDLSDNGYYTLISLTDPAYWSGAEQAAETAGAALDILEQALEVYPEGFFSTFRDFRGEGGLRISLVQQLLTNSGSFSAGGIQYNSGAWYNVVLDADDLWGWDNVHHELWHACESRINDAEPDAFSPDSWDVFNPEGFTYTEDFETYYAREDINDYLMGWTEDPWFQQTYSTVTPMEDRATLLAACFDSLYDPGLHGYDTAVQWVCSYPHLEQKLRYMHEAVERVFGQAYWQMPPSEP